jgi:hypothetical protein
VQLLCNPAGALFVPVVKKRPSGSDPGRDSRVIVGLISSPSERANACRIIDEKLEKCIPCGTKAAGRAKKEGGCKGDGGKEESKIIP